MSSVVYKYPLAQGSVPQAERLHLRHGYEITHVGQQNDVPTLWISLDPNEERKVDRWFMVIPTGHEIPFGYCVGTTFLHNFEVVAHVFCVPAPGEPVAP